MANVAVAIYRLRLIQLFADDTNLFISTSTISEPDHKANLQIIDMNKWLIATRLHLRQTRLATLSFYQTNPIHLQ